MHTRVESYRNKVFNIHFRLGYTFLPSYFNSELDISDPHLIAPFIGRKESPGEYDSRGSIAHVGCGSKPPAGFGCGVACVALNMRYSVRGRATYRRHATSSIVRSSQWRGEATRRPKRRLHLRVRATRRRVHHDRAARSGFLTCFLVYPQ